MRSPSGALLPLAAGIAASVALVELAGAGRIGATALAMAAGGAASAAYRLSMLGHARSTSRLGPPHPIAGFFFGVLLGTMASGVLPLPAATGIRAGSIRSFQGVAIEDSVAYGEERVVHRLRLAVVEGAAERSAARGTVRILARGGPASYVGQLVEVRGPLEPARERSRDDFTASAKASDVLPGPFGSPIMSARRTLREALDLRVQQMGYPFSGFFLAMFVGDRDGVSDELQSLFRDSGCLHVLALSGTHLVLVYAIAAFLARPLPLRRTRVVLPLLVVTAYVFLAGPLPSLLRALAMLVVAWLAAALERERSGLELLAVAAASILLFEPRMLFDLSFQLSVCAVGGMVTVGAAVADRVRRFVPPVAATALSAAAGAQAAVAPLLLGAFGVFQPIGLVSGLVVAPLATGLLVAGLADLALPLWLPLPIHAAMTALLNDGYRILELVLAWFSRFPQSRSWLSVALIWSAVAAIVASRLVPGLRVRFPRARLELRQAIRHGRPG